MAISPESFRIGPAVKNLLLARHDGLVARDGRWIEIVGRRLLRLEIAVRIAPADQDGAVLGPGDLADIGRNVAHGEADAPIVRLVWHRTVYELDVVQRHLPRISLHVRRGDAGGSSARGASTSGAGSCGRP